MDIISSKILNSSSNKKTGSILFENDICFTISTIDNDIILYKDKSKDLFVSCEKGDTELIHKLIQIPKIVNIQNEYGWTPIIVAIYNNQKKIVKTLLMNGADLFISNFKGTTPLMYAKSAYVKHNDPEILELLLSFDLDIYQKDYSCKDVLNYCLENNETEVLTIIKENKR